MAIRYLLAPRKPVSCVALLGDLVWKRNQFCRGWLITGDTGPAKRVLHQPTCTPVFQHEPKWGGLCIDERACIGKRFRDGRKLRANPRPVQLQIRTDDADTKWQPPHRFNLTGDRIFPILPMPSLSWIPRRVWAGGDKGFFKSQAQTHIAYALELLAELQQPVTLAGAYTLLSNQMLLKEGWRI